MILNYHSAVKLIFVIIEVWLSGSEPTTYIVIRRSTTVWYQPLWLVRTSSIMRLGMSSSRTEVNIFSFSNFHITYDLLLELINSFIHLGI